MALPRALLDILSRGRHVPINTAPYLRRSITVSTGSSLPRARKRRRAVHPHVMISEEERALIQEHMAEAGIRNMGAYIRKMTLDGYALHVDLSPAR